MNDTTKEILSWIFMIIGILLFIGFGFITAITGKIYMYIGALFGVGLILTGVFLRPSTEKYQ